jgi:hypothetical protein
MWSIYISTKCTRIYLINVAFYVKRLTKIDRIQKEWAEDFVHVAEFCTGNTWVTVPPDHRYGTVVLRG